MNIITAIVGFFSGVTASLGLGGGFVLLLYLTAIQEMDQLQAQGINLLFFLPIAALSLIVHIKNKLIDKEPLLPCILCGVIGVFAGTTIAFWIPTSLLSKIFAVFILIIGCKELFFPKKDDSSTKSSSYKHQKLNQK